MKAVLFVKFSKDNFSAVHAGTVFECMHVFMGVWLGSASTPTFSTRMSADVEVGQCYEDSAGLLLKCRVN